MYSSIQRLIIGMRYGIGSRTWQLCNCILPVGIMAQRIPPTLPPNCREWDATLPPS